MKKIMSILFVLFTFSLSMLADNNRITKDINELPAKSREFLSTYFSHTKVSHIKIERNLVQNKSYEVLLLNGIDIEFNKHGQWIEVDGNRNAIPFEILPDKIQYYLRQNYAEQEVISAERERYEFSVKLRNGLELTFNRNGKLINIDN